jgi:chromatin remodeling complex protein RSC6
LPLATATPVGTVVPSVPSVPTESVVTPVSLSVSIMKTEGEAVGVEPSQVKDNAVSVIIEKVNTLFVNFKEVQNLLKVLSKDYEKQQKIIEKAQKKRQNAKNSPSGFAKPNKISDELCDFIGVPHGTEKSRTDITRFINSYVKEHNLNKPENKRFILPDDKLKKILNVGDKEDINYFILQKLISHHFPPSASKLAASV